MPQFMAKRSVMTKFRKMHKVKYRQEDEIVNSPHSYTSLECSTYRTSKDGEKTLQEESKIQVNNIDMRKRKMQRDSSQNQLHDLSMEQYVTAKSTVDIYT